MAKIQLGASIEDWITRAPEYLVAVPHRLRELIQNLPTELEERVKWSQPCDGPGVSVSAISTIRQSPFHGGACRAGVND